MHFCRVRYGIESAGERVDATKAGMNTGTGRDKGYTGRQVRNYNERRTGWREATTGRLYGGRSWSDNTRDTQKGFGYTVNRDRCVLKDGVYWGEGNRELQPHGHMVEIWAENAQNVIIDCGGRGVGKNVFTADRHSGERASVLGSVTMHGVVMRRCRRTSSGAAWTRCFDPSGTLAATWTWGFSTGCPASCGASSTASTSTSGIPRRIPTSQRTLT